MLVTNHVLSGAVVGRHAPNPLLAAVAGFASHFALDLVPHFGVEDADLMKVAVPDGLVGLAAIGAVLVRTSPGHRLRVAAAVAASCAPDLDKPARQFVGRSPYPAWFDGFHSRIQRESTRRLPLELAAAAVFAAALSATGPGRGRRGGPRRPRARRTGAPARR